MNSLTAFSPQETSYRTRPIVLNVILDGVGLARKTPDCFKTDAFGAADTPVLDHLKEVSLYRDLYAHGTYVGLPSDQEMGNSEVGHNALGSGRIFPQGAKLINHFIEQKEIDQNRVWQNLIQFSQQHRSAIHLIGLLSDGYVHSHLDHLKYLVLQAARAGIKHIFLHALLDGRDVSPHSSPWYVKSILDYFVTIEKKYQVRCQIASVAGRMRSVMDRYEADWSMVERGWNLMVEGKAEKQFEDPLAGIKELKQSNQLSDQYLEPFVVVKDHQPVGMIEDGDGVLLFNFRGDRAIEICRAFEDQNLPDIKRNKFPNVFFVGMMQYDGDLQIPRNFLVSPPKIEHTMGEYLVDKGIKLFAVSETQKYGHVTYFWNGNRSSRFSDDLEEYIEIKSDRVPFEERPWMKSAEITDKSIELIRSGDYRFGRINYPNGDMVGHSGDFKATKMAVEAVDLALGRLLQTVKEVKGMAIVTADHGNCDEMMELDGEGRIKLDGNGRPTLKTSHTLNPVPLYIFDPSVDRDQLEYEWVGGQAGIAQIAATTFNLMGYRAPEDYEPSLVRWKK